MVRLTEDIKSYVERHDPSNLKHIFFKGLLDKIQNNKLTLADLTNSVYHLGSDDLLNLFATQSLIRSRAHGEAATLIKRLYAAFGVKLNQHILTQLTNGTLMTPQQREKLNSALYQQWRKDPLNQAKERALLNELTASPANLLSEGWKDRDDQQFVDDLNTLIQQTPQYGAKLLELIYLTSDDEDKEQFIERLMNAIEQSQNHLFVLEKSHPVLVTHWVMRHPEHYFCLSGCMRVAVLQNLHETAPELLAELNNIAHTVRPELTEVLLDRSIRHQRDNPRSQALHAEISACVADEAPELMQDDQVNAALGVIKKYLKQKPNQFKTDFFQELAKQIRDNKSFNIELLQTCLNAVDQSLLFAKWTGRTNSRAAEVMASLYQIASLNQKNLSRSELSDMVTQGSLPDHAVNQVEFIEQKVKEVLYFPAKAQESQFNRYIAQTINEMETKAQHLIDTKHQKQVLAEAVYQNYLINVGLKVAMASDQPVFDPQGHVTVFLTLEEGDYLDIINDMRQNGIEVKNKGSIKERVEAVLGSKITNPTLCSLDITQNEALKEKFGKWLGNPQLAEILLNHEERSSIIQLQQEMAMHVLLSWRVLSKKSNVELDFNEIISKVNEKVQERFKSELIESTANEYIDMVGLNQRLNAARKELASECRQSLVEFVCERHPETDWDYIIEQLDKHDFTSTTATGLDFLYSDSRNQTATRISATDKTAHDKKTGAENQALRILYRNHYDPSHGIVRPHSTQTMEARVPSIADKEASTRKGIKDVADKLDHDYHELKKQATHSSGPMIYNLLTSLHSVIYDILPFIEFKNRQRLSADYILQGAHLYNLRQIGAGNSNALIYIQNIPVNQHTNKLDDRAFDDVTREATLMTDIALLSTLRHHSGVFSPIIRQDLNNVYTYAQQKYASFLSAFDSSNSYFHKTLSGHSLIKILSMRKSLWNDAPRSCREDDSLTTLAVKVLFTMYAQNMHRNPQFGMLAQSLSVFVEPMSLTGCKSGNERYQAVSGRVDLLKSISSRNDHDLSQTEQTLKQALYDLVKGTASFENLQEAMDTAYNHHNLQGAGASISMEDQGAGSKLVATKNIRKPGIISEYDTNVAESGFLNKLFQSGCSAMQSHKAKLVELFKKLFEEYEKPSELNLN